MNEREDPEHKSKTKRIILRGKECYEKAEALFIVLIIILIL